MIDMVETNDYEVEFENFLLAGIKKKYNGIRGDLFLYLILRYSIVNQRKKINLDVLVDDMCRDLSITLPATLLFDGKQVHFTKFGVINALWNINERLMWEIRVNHQDILETDFKEYGTKLRTYVTKKRRHYKNAIQEEKKELDKYYALERLNEIFNLPRFPKTPPLSHFVQSELFSDEELLERYERANMFFNNDISALSEKELQRYLSQNLTLLEEDLKLKAVEYPVEEGFIDILATDKEDNYVIVELKVTNDDKRIIWQSLYYPQQIKKIFNVEKVRMIVVAPAFPKHIEEPLEMIGNIECYSYSVSTLNKKIENLRLQKEDLP